MNFKYLSKYRCGSYLGCNHIGIKIPLNSSLSSKYSSPAMPCVGYELCCIESLSGMNVSVVINLMISFPILRLLIGVLNFLRTFYKLKKGEDLDQTQHSKASDLDLLCLPKFKRFDLAYTSKCSTIAVILH